MGAASSQCSESNGEKHLMWHGKNGCVAVVNLPAETDRQAMNSLRRLRQADHDQPGKGFYMVCETKHLQKHGGNHSARKR